jgi:hypothetical protein
MLIWREPTTETARKYNRAGWVLYYKPGCKWCDALKVGLKPAVWAAMKKVDVAAHPERRPAVVKTVPTWVNGENSTWDGRPTFRV